jgi:hypothetical protein
MIHALLAVAFLQACAAALLACALWLARVLR